MNLHYYVDKNKLIFFNQVVVVLIVLTHKEMNNTVKLCTYICIIWSKKEKKNYIMGDIQRDKKETTKTED